MVYLYSNIVIEINRPNKADRTLSVMGNGELPNRLRVLGVNKDAAWWIYTSQERNLYALYSGILGTGEFRPADILGSEDSGIDCGESYVITVLGDVT